MYCDYDTCCVKHWREGGGVGGGIILDAGARHRKVCPRTHTTDESDDEDEEEGGEECMGTRGMNMNTGKHVFVH